MAIELPMNKVVIIGLVVHLKRSIIILTIIDVLHTLNDLSTYN